MVPMEPEVIFPIVILVLIGCWVVSDFISSPPPPSAPPPNKRSQHHPQPRPDPNPDPCTLSRSQAKPSFKHRSAPFVAFPQKHVEAPVPQTPKTISGKAWVTDGDGIRVSGKEIRLAGLDAPEHYQPAKSRNGKWFDHGKRVKIALIKKVGGKNVCVTINSQDKYGRYVGVVRCDGEDIGEWLVREGHAISAYDPMYKQVEQEAQRARRGMWDHAVNIDPRDWRHRPRKGGKFTSS